MKTPMTFLLTFAVSTVALAQNQNFYGAIVSAPTTISVVKENGTQVQYSLILDAGGVTSAVTGSSLTLFKTGTRKSCAEILGKLSGNFPVALKSPDGEHKIVNVGPSNSQRTVYVYGCPMGSNTTEILQLTVKGKTGL